MKIATFNINNVNKRLRNLVEWLENAKPDVVCLQELKATDSEFPLTAIERAGYGSVWRGQKSWNGVAILARGCQAGSYVCFGGHCGHAERYGPRPLSATRGSRGASPSCDTVWHQTDMRAQRVTIGLKPCEDLEPAIYYFFPDLARIRTDQIWSFMSADPSSTSPDAILAAGGIVLGSEKNAGKSCLVRRHRYPGEIALPKGKLRTGETLIEAAQREVSEETGCEVKILEYAGTTHYLVENVPKAVFYFVMKTDGNEGGRPKDKEEIEKVEWLTPRDALRALTHREDRDLISAVFGLTKVPTARINQVFGAPDRDRLAGEISQTWIELDKQIQGDGPLALTEPWARAACRLLLQAEGYLANRNLQQAWVALQSAQRAMLSNPDDKDTIARAAIVLRREVETEKITGWRSRAIKDLIGEPGGEPDPKRVIHAVSLRDDQNNTTYFKIALRRRHLIQLFSLLLVGIGVFLLLSFLGLGDIIDSPFVDLRKVAAVLLFGALGALVSVSQGLLATHVSAKIPAQQIGSVVVWMRPAIGATLALVALVVLHGNEKFEIFNADKWNTKHLGVVLVFAFIAGFSERFVVGAIERIAAATETNGGAKS